MRGHQRRRRDARTSHPGAARSVDGPPAEGAHRRIEGGHRRRCTPLAGGPVGHLGFYEAWGDGCLGCSTNIVAARAQGRRKNADGRQRIVMPSSLFLLTSFLAANTPILL